MPQGGACGAEGGDGEDIVWDVEGGGGGEELRLEGRSCEARLVVECFVVCVCSGVGDCGVVAVLVGGWHVRDSHLINYKTY